MSDLAVIASSDTLVALLASAALKGSVILLAALLFDLALRRHTAALRHRVWTVAFAALLLVPLAVPLAPNWNLPLLPAGLTPAVEADGGLGLGARASQSTGRPADVEPMTARGGSTADAESASGDRDALSMTRNVDATPVRTGTPARAAVIPWAALAVAVWGVGAILLLAQLGIAAARASLLCRRARRLADPAWNGLLESVRERLGLQAPVALVLGDTAHVPMVWGIRRHHVLLPADAERWSVERREVVLLHELAHVRRADCLVHLLSGLVAALYWPNPLVWIARRRQVAERELACDDTVLTSGTRGADYAWHVLEIARAPGNTPRLAPAGVSMARKSQLEGRVLAALDDSRDRRPLSRFGKLLPMAAGVLMAVGLAGLQPWAAQEVAAQQPVSREPAAQEASDQGRETRERVVQLMVGLLDDPDVSIRRQAVASLGQMEDPAAVAALSDAVVNDDDARVRAQSAWALGMIESPDAVASLGRALSDADVNVRAQAAWALGMIESPEGVAHLVPVLDDVELEVRERAVWALGMIEWPDAVDGLAIALGQDAAPSVRKQAAWALGMIEDEAGLEALIDAVEDENAAVREQALRAISRIVG